MIRTVLVPRGLFVPKRAASYTSGDRAFVGRNRFARTFHPHCSSSPILRAPGGAPCLQRDQICAKGVGWVPDPEAPAPFARIAAPAPFRSRWSCGPCL